MMKKDVLYGVATLGLFGVQAVELIYPFRQFPLPFSSQTLHCTNTKPGIWIGRPPGHAIIRIACLLPREPYKLQQKLYFSFN